MSTSILGVLRRVEYLRDILVSVSRAFALSLLWRDQMSLQYQDAITVFRMMEAASKLDEFTERHFSLKRRTVTWSPTYRPDRYGALDPMGEIDWEKLLQFRSRLVASAHAAVQELCGQIDHSHLYDPLRFVIQDTAVVLPADGTEFPLLPSSTISSPIAESVERTLLGPRHAPIDRAFVPSFSLLHTLEPGFGDSDAEKVIHLWCLSLHEATAAQLCALTMVEFDGLPFNFYRDMGKQVFDEMRHSLFFIEAAKTLLPVIEEQMPVNHPLRLAVAEFRKTQRGLPVPLEGSLFETFWNADLSERLILMHLDTETPGVGAIRRHARSPFWNAYPMLREGLELIATDELTHAQLGRRWIDHLLPDRRERERKIEDTRLLRGMLLATSIAHQRQATVADVMANLIDLHVNGKALEKRSLL